MKTNNKAESRVPSSQQHERKVFDRKSNMTELPVLNLKIKTRVDKINIDGVVRTKEDFVVDHVKELFKAKDFSEVLLSAQRVRENLESLGCFRRVGIFIDESKGPHSSPDGLEVTFEVQEDSRMVGVIDTMIGSNEGGISVGLQMPNTFGRGEKLLTEYKYGSNKTSGLNLTFKKPHKGSLFPNLTATIFQGCSESPWSGYKQAEKSILLDFSWFLVPIKHHLQWEGNWRDLSFLSNNVPFSIREESGPSLKSSLRYILSVDTRNARAFPSRGYLLHLTNELAGLGGDMQFRKHELKYERNISLMPSVVVQGTVHGGIMSSKGNFFKAGICDKFFLGGPLSVRGFRTGGIGPHDDNCSLGGNIYWAAGLHLFTPLPFLAGKQGWRDLFRAHLFYNAGCLNFADTDKTSSFWRNLYAEMRSVYGAGLAIRLGGVARVELNYCVPLKFGNNDVLDPGFRFGIGLEFL